MVVSGAAVVVTLVVSRVGSREMGPSPTFLPAVLAVVACFDVLSVYLLIGEHHDTGDRRSLAMAVAYLWSLVVMTGYALAFPGVVSVAAPLAVTPSVAPWLYVCWHTGFPLLLGVAWAPWPRGAGGTVTAVARRTALARTTGLVTVAVAAGVVAAVTLAIHHLPVLIHGRDTSRMTQLTAPVTVPLVVLAVGLCFVGTRRRGGPETWTSVAVLVCLCDLVMTYSTHQRYSLGWYGGRALTVLAAGVVLFAMLSGFRRVKSQAEFAAAYDFLTGLPNRRSVLDSLDRSFASTHRAGSDLALVSVDLDSFKSVNDTYGHAVGDALLTAVGSALSGAVRAGDLVGRVGGEEFLAVLPDTEVEGASVVAERMRQAVAAVRVVSVDRAFSASFGISGAQGSADTVTQMLRRADEALYAAKTSGRDRVEVAQGDRVPTGRVPSTAPHRAPAF